MNISPQELEELEIELNNIRDRTQDWAIEDYTRLIEKLGNYFTYSLPRTVKHNWIIEIESILHNLKVNFDEDSYRLSLKENLIEALSIASALAGEIHKANKIKGRRLGSEFYKDVINLGEALSNLPLAIRVARKPQAKRTYKRR